MSTSRFFFVSIRSMGRHGQKILPDRHSVSCVRRSSVPNPACEPGADPFAGEQHLSARAIELGGQQTDRSTVSRASAPATSQAGKERHTLLHAAPAVPLPLPLRLRTCTSQ